MKDVLEVVNEAKGQLREKKEVAAFRNGRQVKRNDEKEENNIPKEISSDGSYTYNPFKEFAKQWKEEHK